MEKFEELQSTTIQALGSDMVYRFHVDIQVEPNDTKHATVRCGECGKQMHTRGGAFVENMVGRIASTLATHWRDACPNRDSLPPL